MLFSGTVPDFERRAIIPVHEGRLESDVFQDVLKTFVFERHHKTGKVGVGFVKGFGIKGGAMASTVAHDAHNLLVVGTNDADMALAANTLILLDLPKEVQEMMAAGKLTAGHHAIEIQPGKQE